MKQSRRIWDTGSAVFRWEASGILFIILVGTALHFVFEWSGKSAAVGAFASVNESVWEHFKQSVWPACLYAAIEYPFLRGRVNNFSAAKAAAFFLMPLITGAVFYAYTSIIERHILTVDIGIFILAVIIGQAVSYSILSVPRLSRWANLVSLLAIIGLVFLLVLFTYFPPHLPIFLDETGFYGLPY